MKAPNKIYIAATPNKLIEIWSEEPIESKPYITEHEYIRKDALLEKINGQIRICEELKAEGRDDVFYTAEIDAFEQTKRIIESL